MVDLLCPFLPIKATTPPLIVGQGLVQEFETPLMQQHGYGVIALGAGRVTSPPCNGSTIISLARPEPEGSESSRRKSVIMEGKKFLMRILREDNLFLAG